MRRRVRQSPQTLLRPAVAGLRRAGGTRLSVDWLFMVLAPFGFEFQNPLGERLEWSSLPLVWVVCGWR